MSNYINEVSIWGLMNKNAFLNTDVSDLSFYKVKNKSKAVYFKYDPELATKHKQTNFMYLDEAPEGIKGVSCMEQIVSEVNHMYFYGITDPIDKKHKEIMSTVRHYHNLNNIKFKPIEIADVPAILDMIEKWRYAENGGMKYMWQEHAAIDKACVHKYVNDEEFASKTLGFVFYNDDWTECLGYSLIANYVDSEGEIKYLTRKVFNQKGYRNLTEYIDWATFYFAWVKVGNPENLYINWGCSSGGVHWYKTHKWKIHSLEKKYFVTVKN